MKALNSLGRIYREQSDFVKALNYYKKSFDIGREVNDSIHNATLLCNIGVLYMQQEELVKAINHLKKGADIHAKLNNKRGIAYSLLNLGSCYTRAGRLKLALEKLSAGLIFSRQIEDRALVSKFLTKKGRVFMLTNKLDSAELLLTKGLQLAQELESPRLIRHASKPMVSLYEKLANAEQTYRMYKLFIGMRDSLNIHKDLRKLDQQKNNKKILAKEKEIALLNNEKEKKNILWIFSISIMLALTLIITYRFHQRKKGLEKELTTLKLYNQENPVNVTTSKKISSIPVIIRKKVMTIDLETVIYFKTEARYVFLTNKEGKSFLVNYNMGDLENQLPNNFVRIHRAIIINTNEILHLEKTDRGKVLFTFKGDESKSVRSSLGYANNVKTLVSDFKRLKS